MWALVAVLVVVAAPPESEPSSPPPDQDNTDQPMEQVTFGEAIDRSLSQNPTLIQALEEVDRSKALIEQARSYALPTLTGNNFLLHQNADRVALGKVVSAANQFNSTLLATVPILNTKAWAGVFRQQDQADLQAKLAADVRRMIALQAGRAYLTIIAQHRQVEVNQRARDTDRVQLEFTEQRYRGGVGNRLDVTRSGQELASAEAQLQNTLSALTMSREALGVIIGAKGPVEVKDEPTLNSPTSMGTALDKAQKERTDVIAGKRRLEAARRSSGLNWLDYLPLVTAVGDIAYQNPPLITQPVHTWQVELLISIPFYDGGLRYGQAKERRALEAEAQTNLEGTLRQASSDVRASFEGLRRADLAMQAARDGARLATESLKLAELAYRTGVSTNLELVDAQRTARDADTAAAASEDNARQARLDLLSSSGSFP